MEKVFRDAAPEQQNLWKAFGKLQRMREKDEMDRLGATQCYLGCHHPGHCSILLPKRESVRFEVPMCRRKHTCASGCEGKLPVD